VGASVEYVGRDCTRATPDASVVTAASAGWIEVSMAPDVFEMHHSTGGGPDRFLGCSGSPWTRREFVARSVDDSSIEIGVSNTFTQLGGAARVVFDGETIDAKVARLAGRYAIITIPNTDGRASRICPNATTVELEAVTCKRVP
jgi:hypothetical protein